MSPDRWQKVQNVYFSIIEKTPEERMGFLDTVCADDVELRNEVQSLLRCKNNLGDFLEETAIQVLVSGYGLSLEEEPGGLRSLTGVVIDDRYLVSDQIGSGGMGEVYRANHRLLEMPVAVKRLSAEFRNRNEYRQRFVAEARRAVPLDHENIAQVKDVVEQANEVFVIMEFIDGQTLRKRLDRPVTVDEFLPIAIQCASALAAAHQHRIVHLDIKPENIMLTASNKVKICDFGIARQISESGDSPKDSAPWTFAGTPAYMAPEVIRSSRFDERADIFSLGLVFYEMLAGKHPFRSEDIRATTRRISQDDAPLLTSASKSVPADLSRLVHKMLAKSPDERQSAAAVLRELQTVRRHRRIFAETWRTVLDAGVLLMRRPLSAFACALVLLAGIAVPAVYLRPVSEIAPLPEKKLLLILPFKVIGDAGDERFYSEGVSTILTAKLAEVSSIPGLQIAPASLIRTASIDSLEKARGEFGATLLLSGTFQFLGNQVRIAFALTDTSSRRSLASSEKTVEISDPFKLQDMVVRDVVHMLRGKLTATEQQAISVYGTYDFKAFSLYTSGVGALANYQSPENIEKAVNLLSQAVDQDDRYALAHAALGKAYWQRFSRSRDAGWLDLSRNSCERAAALDLHLSEAQVCLGRVYEERGDYDLAVEYYRRAVDYSPGNDDGHRALGSVLEKLNLFDDAEKTYQHAIELRPQYWAGYSWLAVFYDRRHRYSESIDQFYKALALSPGNAQVCYSLALAYLDDSQFENAVKTLEKAIELAPYFEAPYGNLGLTYLRRGLFDKAVAPLEKAASINRNYRSLGNLARIYWLVGRRDEARENYELAIADGDRLLQQNPRDAGIHLLVGRYYAMLGKKPEAISHITQALHLHTDDPHYLMIAATAYVQLGDRNEALSLVEQAIRPGFGSAHISEEPELSVLKAEPRYAALIAAGIQTQ